MGLGAGSLCGCAVPGGCSGRVPTAPVFLGLGTAPVPAGDTRCPWIPVAASFCGGCRCAARLDARSCWGLCGLNNIHLFRTVQVVFAVYRQWALFLGGQENLLFRRDQEYVTINNGTSLLKQWSVPRNNDTNK